MTQAELTPSERIKKLHRSSGAGRGLKPFARDLAANDKKQVELVTAWFSNKRGPKTAPKPRAPAMKPAPAPAPVRKR